VTLELWLSHEAHIMRLMWWCSSLWPTYNVGNR